MEPKGPSRTFLVNVTVPIVAPPSTVLQTIVNVVDFGMNAQEAVDAGRIHHQWLPDRIVYERFSLSPDTLAVLRAKGHDVEQGGTQGAAEVIIESLSPPTRSLVFI